MNLTKYLLPVLAFLFTGFLLQGQACKDFFPQKEGAVLQYVNYDKKDKVTGSSEMSFKEKKQKDDYTSVVFISTYRDKKGEAVYENEVEVDCKDGVLYFSSSKFLDPSTMSAYESMEVEVDATHMEMPLNGKAGTELQDGSVNAVISSNGMKIISISVNVFNRKIEAIETIDTPAGSFECIRNSYDALSQIGFVKMNISAVEWYCPDVGTIRSESYNKNGKLMSYTVLESIK
ncbi:MAG: hypothetical protein ABFS28_14980 [Bacteroidota bacterium]